MSKSNKELKIEKKLVKQARKSAEAFGKLYDIYFAEIYTYLSFKVGKHLAEDLTSQTFENALVKIKDFKWKGYSFGSWLYKIAHNLVIDEYRRQNENVVTLDGNELTIQSEDLGPDEIAELKIETKNLLDAMEDLSSEQREIIYFRYIKELTIEETMQITGKSIDSVKSLSKRALHALKNKLNYDGD